MIPLTNYDYSEGEQASVVMKFTQIDDANILETNSPRETRQKNSTSWDSFFQFQEFGSHIDIEKTANQLSKP